VSRLLVTGGAEFIGSNFVHLALQRRPQDGVVVPHALTYARMALTVQWYGEREGWWRPMESGAYREYYRRQYVERLGVV
jgi:dTDP-D-glucose 4,6-dehydratase